MQLKLNVTPIVLSHFRTPVILAIIVKKLSSLKHLVRTTVAESHN